MVYRGGLENRCAERHRGFKSYPRRIVKIGIGIIVWQERKSKGENKDLKPERAKRERTGNKRFC